ncbi:MAG: EamA family transporter, partial [Solirubrobacterales bacterium]
FLPAMGFAVMSGGLNVALKLAMPGIDWRQFVIWSGVAYLLTAFALIVVGGWMLPFGAGTEWAMLTGLLSTGGAFTLFVALERGEATLVVPITAAYPVVSAVIAALFLSEVITPLRAAGIIAVVVGAMIIGREQAPEPA